MRVFRVVFPLGSNDFMNPCACLGNVWGYVATWLSLIITCAAGETLTSSLRPHVPMPGSRGHQQHSPSVQVCAERWREAQAGDGRGLLQLPEVWGPVLRQGEGNRTIVRSSSSSYVIAAGVGTIAELHREGAENETVENDQILDLNIEKWCVYGEVRTVIDRQDGFLRLKRRKIGQTWARSIYNLNGLKEHFTASSLTGGCAKLLKNKTFTLKKLLLCLTHSTV